MRKTELENCPQWLMDARTENEDVVIEFGKVVWRGGTWWGGDQGIRCKWCIYITSDGQLSIGCKTRTVQQWDSWFAGTEEYETKRDSDDFRRIRAAYMGFVVYCREAGLLPAVDTPAPVAVE
jgi:hypothetical protein